jgi:hypothetical protein
MLPYLAGAGSSAVALWRSVSSMPAQVAFDKLQQCVSVALLAPADLVRFRHMNRGLTWAMFGSNSEGLMDATGGLHGSVPRAGAGAVPPCLQATASPVVDLTAVQCMLYHIEVQCML